MQVIYRKPLEMAKQLVSGLDKRMIIEKYNEYSGSDLSEEYEWQGVFVSVISRMAGMPVREIPDFHNCLMGKRKFKNFGRWRDKEGYLPKPGDVILFSSRRGQCAKRCGFVEYADENRVYTVEADMDRCRVCTGKHSIDSPDIAGYGTPRY